jgi:diacylglycerol O-acyltransferase
MRLLAAAALDQLREARRDLFSVAGAVAAPRHFLTGLGTAARGAYAFARLLRPLPGTSLVGPITGHRRWKWTTVELSELRAVQHQAGVTLNDVALTIVSGALRRYLMAHDEQPLSHPIRSLVPVSVRVDNGEGVLDNQVSALVPKLPVDVADPLERLQVVHERLAELKVSGEASAGQLITRLADSSPWVVEEAFLRATVHFASSLVTTVTTNVPGPPIPLTVLGRPLLELVPYVPLGYHVRVGVAMLSYADRFCFAVTADDDAISDIEVLVEGLREETVLLVNAALGSGRGQGAADPVDATVREHAAR